MISPVPFGQVSTQYDIVFKSSVNVSINVIGYLLSGVSLHNVYLVSYNP